MSAKGGQTWATGLLHGPVPLTLTDRSPALLLSFAKGDGMAENKTKANELSVAAFLETVTDESRKADAKALIKLLQQVSGEKPKMWGSAIIGFGSRHYKYESGREGDAPLIGFSPRKAATVLYGLAIHDAEELLAKLGKHSTGKGCLYIKKLADVDSKVLKAIASKAVQAHETT
jgi:hypothetical protein